MTNRQDALTLTDPAHLREQIAEFFAPDRWHTPPPDFEHSGYALVDQVYAR